MWYCVQFCVGWTLMSCEARARPVEGERAWMRMLPVRSKLLDFIHPEMWYCRQGETGTAWAIRQLPDWGFTMPMFSMRRERAPPWTTVVSANVLWPGESWNRYPGKVL